MVRWMDGGLKWVVKDGWMNGMLEGRKRDD